MVISVSSNIPSLNAQRSLTTAQTDRDSTLQQLSSGKRVNSTKDDAAASAIIERFAAQIAGNAQAVRNLNDGVSLVQVAEGASTQLQDNTQRIRELAVASANGTLSASDRAAIQAEADQLNQSNADILQNTEFNGNKVFQTSSQTLQAGPNAGDTLSINGVSLNGVGGQGGLYGATGAIDLSSAASATAALDQLDTDLQRISTVRSTYGAAQSRIEASVANLTSSSINQAAAKSRMGDTDYAKSLSDFSAQQVRGQAAIAVQAQANAIPSQVISLLR